MSQPGPWGQQPGQSPGQQPSAPGGWRPPSGQGWSGAQPPYPHGQAPSGYGPYGQQPPGQPGQGQRPPYGAPPGPPSPGSRALRSAGFIIGIVVAALVLLIAIGAIITVLGGRSSGATPGTVITPSSQSPIPTTDPSTAPTTDPSTAPTTEPSGGGGGTTSGDTYSLPHGVSLEAAAGWVESSKKASIVSLASPDNEIFSGQVTELAGDDEPSSVVTTWLKQVAEDMGDVEYGDVKDIDVGAENLHAASGVMAGTVSTSQGSVYVLTQAVVSVRQTDGVTVIATLRYFEDSDTGELGKDFGTMVGSMVSSQAAG